MPVKVVILVGGETSGTRFRPLTMDIPKVLFPIAGKPLVSHIIDSLIDQLEDELHEIFLISFFKDSSTFDKYIANAETLHPNLKLTYLAEPYSLGTAGGLYFFRDKILGKHAMNEDNKILLIHGDVVCNYPFKKLLDFSEEKNSDAVILGIDPLLLVNDFQTLPDAPNISKFYDKDHIFKNYGTIVSNKDTSSIVHYVEKPKSDNFAKFQDTAYDININGGVYVFGNKIFSLLEKAQAVKSAKTIQLHDDIDNDDDTNNNILSFELDVFKALPSHESVSFLTFKSESFWYQLKTPVFALLANNFFLKQGGEILLSSLENIISPVKSLGSEPLKSQNYKIGPNVSIGRNVKIGNGVRLKNCIIADDVIIEDHSFVVNAIISQGVKIGKWCRIEGTINTPSINRDISKFTSDNYLKLINNIVILCRGTVVGNQVLVYNSIVLPYKELKADVKYEIIM